LDTYARLYDAYGKLLTKKQSECFEMRYGEDYSLAEIGEALGISPQAVADQIKRTLAKMREYESKLGLLRKHGERLGYLNAAADLLRKATGSGEDGANALTDKQMSLLNGFIGYHENAKLTERGK
jgi:hypothetical protein